MKKQIIYLVAFQAIDGNDLVAFTDPADTMNFIMDIEDHVLGMMLSVDEQDDLLHEFYMLTKAAE